jgi:hypothetical protein
MSKEARNPKVKTRLMCPRKTMRWHDGPRGWISLEKAIQPRMDTDGHGYQGLAEELKITRRMNELPVWKSVVIRGHPWFMTSLADFNCRFQD